MLHKAGSVAALAVPFAQMQARSRQQACMCNASDIPGFLSNVRSAEAAMPEAWRPFKLNLYAKVARFRRHLKSMHDACGT